MYFHGLGNNILVLNSMKAVNDLLDKRGGIYSHRPVSTVAGELMGLDQVRILFNLHLFFRVLYFSYRSRRHFHMASSGGSTGSSHTLLSVRPQSGNTVYFRKTSPLPCAWTFCVNLKISFPMSGCKCYRRSCIVGVKANFRTELLGESSYR